jgi:hypothetical protein
MPPPINPNPISYCSTCSCLGYFGAEVRTRLEVVSHRNFKDFEFSANEEGCSYCAVALQCFALFRTIVSNLQVELLLYPNSPTEMHSKPEEGQSEVLEIYPCPSKPDPTIPTLWIILIVPRRINQYQAIMARSS